LNTGRETRVSTAVTRVTEKLFQNDGRIGAYLIMGGVDVKGPHVAYIHAKGNHAYLPFIAMGSGSLNCIAILETKYRDNMNAVDAESLMIEAISAGIVFDMGSGSNVDVCHVKRGSLNMKRNVKIGASRVKESIPYKFPKDNTRNSLFDCK